MKYHLKDKFLFIHSILVKRAQIYLTDLHVPPNSTVETSEGLGQCYTVYTYG